MLTAMIAEQAYFKMSAFIYVRINFTEILMYVIFHLVPNLKF